MRIAFSSPIVEDIRNHGRESSFYAALLVPLVSLSLHIRSKENKATFINLSDEASDTLTVSGKENPPRQKYPKRAVGKVVCVDSESSDDEFQHLF